MIELIDNISQFSLVLIASIISGALFYKSRLQEYFLLTCFYITFALGSLYWTLYFFLFTYTPEIFYVSELAWIASYIFLLTLQYNLSTPEERKFYHPALWLVPLFCLPQLMIYFYLGDIIYNIVLGALTMTIGWFSLRGLLYSRSQDRKFLNKEYFHINLLIIIILEYGLWTSSCFWLGDSYTNPYFWIDFALTAAMVALIGTTKKAVAQ